MDQRSTFCAEQQDFIWSFRSQRDLRFLGVNHIAGDFFETPYCKSPSSVASPECRSQGRGGGASGSPWLKGLWGVRAAAMKGQQRGLFAMWRQPFAAPRRGGGAYSLGAPAPDAQQRNGRAASKVSATPAGCTAFVRVLVTCHVHNGVSKYHPQTRKAPEKRNTWLGFPPETPESPRRCSFYRLPRDPPPPQVSFL